MATRNNDFDRDGRRDILPGPGARKRATGDLKGRKMRSRNDAKRAAIYIRVASAENGSQQGVERQEVACRELASRLGYLVVEQYQDVGTKERRGLRRMLSELGAIKPTSVITLDPSRFGRRHQDSMMTMALLIAAGVRAVFVHEPGGVLPWQGVSLTTSRPTLVGEDAR